MREQRSASRMGDRKRPLSLVAQFDDFCRLCMKDDDITLDFLNFVKSHEVCRQQWKADKERADRLQSENTRLQATIQDLEKEMEYIRHVLDSHVSERERCAREIKAKTRQLQMIKEFIVNNLDGKAGKAADPSVAHVLEQLNDADHRDGHCDKTDDSVGSVLSPSLDPDDMTEDSVRLVERQSLGCATSHGRRHRPLPTSEDCSGRKRSPAKMQPPTTNMTQVPEETTAERLAHGDGDTSCNGAVIATTTLTISEELGVKATSRVEAVSGRPRGRRSMSDPSFPVTASPVATIKRTCTSDGGEDDGGGGVEADAEEEPGDTEGFEVEVDRLNPSKRSTPIQNSGRAGIDTVQKHTFTTKTVIKPENCKVCGKRIRFYKPALRCLQCRLACHPECRTEASSPCVPVSPRTHRYGAAGPVLSDFTVSTSPMVPLALASCLTEIEHRGLGKAGNLYLSSEKPEKRAEEFVEQMLCHRRVPVLASVDLSVICSAVKGFLSSLKEPLITGSLWKDFVSAAEASDPGDQLWRTRHAVSELPQPNRDTLALVICHLQQVAKGSKRSTVLEDLGRTFGPSVVGFLTPRPSPADVVVQKEKQITVMKCLLAIPQDYWSAFLQPEENNAVRTPEGTTMLGPITLGSRDSRNRRSGFRFRTRPRLPSPSK